MQLRLTTAITLIAAAGLVAACNEENDTAVADADTVIVEEDQVVTETANADGAVSSDVVVPDSPRVVGATGGELESALNDSTGGPAPEGTADSSSELAAAQPAENAPLQSEAELPADETAQADDAVQENQEAVEAAAAATDDEGSPEADEQPAELAQDEGAAEEEGVAEEIADAQADAEQPAADATTETADATTTDQPAATLETTETASATDDASEPDAAGPITEEELASLNLEDLQIEEGDGVERLTAFVEGSDAFDAAEKTTLVAGIEAAKDDPEQMQVLFDQIKEIALSAN